MPKFSHELQSEHIYFKQGFGYEHLQKYLDQRSYIIDLWTRLDVQTVFVNSYVSIFFFIYIFIMMECSFSYLPMYWKSYTD